MLEPPDLAVEALVERVRGAYGVHPHAVEFLPIGADPRTAIYRVLAGERAYLLKLRRGAFDETSVSVPGLLHDQGLRQVIPPLPTTAGALWTSSGDVALVLYPFVVGEDGYTVPLSDAQWVALGAAVRDLHRAQLPPQVARRIPRETFTPAWRATLGDVLAGGGSEHLDDPVASALAALLRAERDRITERLDRAEHLARALRAQPRPAVLCHGDLHAGNVHLSAGGTLHLIDWDTLVFAPRERDFEQIGSPWGGARAWGLFFEGYGAIEPDPLALPYYRYHRILDDLVVACEEVLATGAGGDGGVNRERELDIVRKTLRPGGALDLATRLDGG